MLTNIPEDALRPGKWIIPVGTIVFPVRHVPNDSREGEQGRQLTMSVLGTSSYAYRIGFVNTVFAVVYFEKPIQGFMGFIVHIDSIKWPGDHGK